ncbi:MAG: aldehyde dehydrogenase family protein [Lentisphaeria bacterium]|nr:aldehyde dehydrogenase family protein [Lentisphaeria bacterium]
MNFNTKKFIEDSRNFFAAGNRLKVKERKNLLIKLKSILKNNREKIFIALYEDLHKSEAEATVSEFVPLMDSLNYMIRNIKKFAKPKRVSAGLANLPGYGKIYQEPYGVVLIISTWNYPLLLAIDPLVGAIAAGNKVILKLSPNTPNTNRVLSELLNECFGTENCIVDKDFSLDEILQFKFDYIFFTGGEASGKNVAAAAAKNLTPTTLELGGKSPCVVDDSSDLKLAARRIAWGKFMNAGQTCVAPDYLLVTSKVKEKFLNLLREQIKYNFGNSPEKSPDYVRIINQAHYERLCGLLEEGTLVCGGEKIPDELYIAPTVLDKITLQSKIMEREIFGPILPIITVDNLEEALQIIRNRPKPLAAYYFSNNSRRVETFLSTVSSGGVSINDTVMHLCSANLPFGGVGSSGMGSYHGKASFQTFSHAKSVLIKNKYFDFPLRYLPYSKWKQKIFKIVQKNI